MKRNNSSRDVASVPKVAFDRAPEDWKELQTFVAQFFSELGCRADVSKRVELVRGHKEIDVYVEDDLIEPHALYLCECKHWKRAVDQEVVHGFRTVVADAGATLGYIVASSGFQSGAHTATQKTNVRLVTFEELQAAFFQRWVGAMVQRTKSIFDELFPYWDPTGGRRPSRPWTDADRAEWRELMDRYALVLNHDLALLEMEAPRLLVEGRDPFSKDTSAKLVVRSYRQYFDMVERGSTEALAAFRHLHGEV